MRTAAVPMTADRAVAGWLLELMAAVDADNLDPDEPCRRSRTARLLARPPAQVAAHAALAAIDLELSAAEPLRQLRSDTVCHHLTVTADGASVNLALARMTVPGGSSPGQFSLQAVAFRAVPASIPAWFPPVQARHELCFATMLAASHGFVDGDGTVLFPEQLSVAVRPDEQAFGVVFLPKLSGIFRSHVLPALDAAHLGFDAQDQAAIDAVRSAAFAAHEWGHDAGAQIERTTAVRRRRFAAVLSELHADLAGLLMLLSAEPSLEAWPAALTLVVDRVVREAWLPQPHAQVDAIAARQLLRLLAAHHALWFGPSGLRVELALVRHAIAVHVNQVADVLSACQGGDVRPAVDYLVSSGWRIEGTACRMDLGANLGDALRHNRR